MARRILFVVLLGALLPQTAKADPRPPATLHVQVTDDRHHPLAGARITLAAESVPTDVTVGTTAADGSASLQRARPAADTWRDSLLIEAPGYIPFHSRVDLFTGAQRDDSFRLRPARTTRITVLDPSGKPVAHAPLVIAFQALLPEDEDRLLPVNTPATHTDDRGEYLWTHPALAFDFHLIVAGHDFPSPDASDVTVRLSAAETRRIAPDVSLDLTLRYPDGSPASDWLVAPEAQREWLSPLSGDFLLGDNFDIPAWEAPHPQGACHISHPPRFLWLVSPEGFPLGYALNPSAWEPGPHALTLTLPDVERTIHGRFVDARGNGLASISFSPGTSFPSSVCEWFTELREPSDAPFAGRHVTSGPGGTFSFPVRYGMNFADFHVAGDDYQSSSLPLAALQSASDVRLDARLRPGLPGPTKHILLRFLDSAGLAIDPARFPSVSLYVPPSHPGMSQMGNSVPGIPDRNGVHFFVGPAIAVIETRMESSLWQEGADRLPLTSDLEQVLPMQLDPSPLNAPVHGRLLTADGKPVAGITVYPAFVDPADPEQRVRGIFTSMRAVTDPDGRFSMAAAPNTCALIVQSLTYPSGLRLFPNVPPTPITPDHRIVEIRIPAEMPASAPASTSPPESRSGTLVVTAAGQPLAGAEVALFTAPDPDDGLHLQALALDLTDPSGRICFTAPPHQPLIALARIRGKLEGHLAFQLGDSSSPLTLTLEPAATRAPYAPNHPPADFETRALNRLNSDATWGDRDWGRP